MSKRKKQTGRYVVEINDWGCGTMIKDTLTGKEIDAPAEETVNLCLAEMNRLAAEVERLNELAQDPYRLSRGWQPMETAPKDGTVVLCWDEFKECDFMWYGIIQQWNEPKDILGWMYVATNTECHPTHWMPLPKPPAAKEGKQSKGVIDEQ